METFNPYLPLPLHKLRFDPTYKGWKPSGSLESIGRNAIALILPTRDGNPVTETDVDSELRALILPTRDGNL